ncbi:MAG: HAD family phosphatase [Methylotetracoccus sp.]|nr:HAD family phosphatase [Methylotetracoccus sp.]
MTASSGRRGEDRIAPLPAFRAVVMDMDGLALDTESTYCAAWQSAASVLGFDLSSAFCHTLFGRHADDVKQALSEACDHRLDLAAFHALAEHHWLASLETRGVAKMPGLDRLLSLLRNRRIPYAVATNSDEPYASLCLRAAGVMPDFSVVVTRDQVACGKPEPDLFLEAARRLGVAARDCLALEDSPTGLSACLRAGMIPVWIPATRSEALSQANNGVWVMRGLDQLAEVIERTEP